MFCTFTKHLNKHEDSNTNEPRQNVTEKLNYRYTKNYKARNDLITNTQNYKARNKIFRREE